jgi:hypothetical protein
METTMALGAFENMTGEGGIQRRGGRHDDSYTNKRKEYESLSDIERSRGLYLKYVISDIPDIKGPVLPPVVGGAVTAST